MAINRERRQMLLAGIGAVGAVALSRSAARAATCSDTGPLAPTGPTMRQMYDKIAFEDEGLAEARTPLPSCPSSATAMFSITQPGCYYMTSNVTGTVGMSVIEVLSDNVEIECDGFHFIGVPGTRSCISAPGAQRCIGVYDAGFVQWNGISIDMPLATDCYIEECTFDRCDSSSSPIGAFTCVLGDGGIIDECNVVSCTGGRLHVGAHGCIEETTVRASTGGALSSPGPAVMEDNFLLQNDGAAIVIDVGAVVIGNRVVSCPGGISVGSNSVVSENDIANCLSGISITGSRVTIEENNISTGMDGISVNGAHGSLLIDGNNISGMSGVALTTQFSISCLAVRNTVSSSATAYDFAPSSSWGPIVNAVSVGDLSTTGVATDHPWSNFIY